MGKLPCDYILEKYSPTVYRLAYTRINNHADAEDILQEVFLRFFQSWCEEKFESEEHIKAWLIKVTVNQCKTLLKSAWFKNTSAMDENLPTAERDESEGIIHIVQQLPDKYKTIVHLFYYEDLPVSEISRLTGIGESTVKSRLHRARAKLEIMLKEAGI